MKRIFFDIGTAETTHAFRGVGVYATLLHEYLQKTTTAQNDIQILAQQGTSNIDLIHYPNFDFFFSTLVVPTRAPFVVTVHDTIPLIFPQQYPAGIKGRLRFLGQRHRLHKAAAIITDSECSKNDIHRYLGIPLTRIHVVLLAANPSLSRLRQSQVSSVLKKYKLSLPYFLYVGDMNYNKNLPFLIREFQNLDAHAHLVLVGRNLGNTSIPEGAELCKCIQQTKRSQNIHVLTAVPSTPTEDLSALYSGATAYIQPSLYEGFGLPVLDALRCGVPVLSSNRSSLPEILKTAATYFDPQQNGELSVLMKKLLHCSDEQRRDLIAVGQKVEQYYSWERTASQTIEVYKEVLSRTQ